jgi:hypothetical protein
MVIWGWRDRRMRGVDDIVNAAAFTTIEIGSIRHQGPGDLL